MASMILQPLPSLIRSLLFRFPHELLSLPSFSPVAASPPMTTTVPTRLGFVLHYFSEVAKRVDSYWKSFGDAVEDRSRAAGHDENWDRWRRHFEEIDNQERLLSILKSPTMYLEDYEDAARLKVAFAAAADVAYPDLADPFNEI